jgi:hypothetical protein
MQELLRRDAEEELTDAETKWFADTRPAEELYDLESDPHEMNNLADDPEYRETLERLRTALDDWRERTGDSTAGRESEKQMRDRIWPDGDQPETATPTFVPNAPGNRAREPAPEGGTFDGPVTIDLFCPTQGASIGYRIEDADSDGDGDQNDRHWELYTGPIHVESGETVTLRTKAVRYGYAESDERVAEFRIE